jgi:hypothetical protein
MRSDRSVAGNVAVHEGVDDHDPLAKFRRADDELTFKEFLAGTKVIVVGVLTPSR